MSDEDELAIEVQKVIDAHAATPEISPDWIATETMLAIRFCAVASSARLRRLSS